MIAHHEFSECEVVADLIKKFNGALKMAKIRNVFFRVGFNQRIDSEVIR